MTRINSLYGNDIEDASTKALIKNHVVDTMAHKDIRQDVNVINKYIDVLSENNVAENADIDSMLSDIFGDSYVSTTPSIVSQPSNVVGKVGETAVFTVKATGGSLFYQWQYKNLKSTGFTPSSQDGNQSDTLRVEMTEARDGTLYRCVITDQNGKKIISKEVLLAVVPLIV